MTVPPYADEVRQAIVAAYYPRLTGSPDSVRSRSQASFAIASTLAGGLVGAALISNLSSVSSGVKTLGIAALAVWLTAAGLYISAVGSPVPDLPAASATDPDQFVHEVLVRTRSERVQIERRLFRANVAGFAAALLTGATFVAVLVIGSDPELHLVTVVVDSATAKQLTQTCGGNVPLIGDVTSASLRTSFVEVRPTRRSCPKATELRIPRGAVLLLNQSK